ncbi:MAG: hypothetical protein KDK56_03430 [Simkania sp.]|nr:hypothetical protein [Simkania sp.]MCP5490741.1 hypothetical protein [Chlamydiales bacterium]
MKKLLILVALSFNLTGSVNLFGDINHPSEMRYNWEKNEMERREQEKKEQEKKEREEKEQKEREQNEKKK